MDSSTLTQLINARAQVPRCGVPYFSEQIVPNHYGSVQSFYFNKCQVFEPCCAPSTQIPKSTNPVLSPLVTFELSNSTMLMRNLIISPTFMCRISISGFDPSGYIETNGQTIQFTSSFNQIIECGPTVNIYGSSIGSLFLKPQVECSLNITLLSKISSGTGLVVGAENSSINVEINSIYIPAPLVDFGFGGQINFGDNSTIFATITATALDLTNLSGSVPSIYLNSFNKGNLESLTIPANTTFLSIENNSFTSFDLTGISIETFNCKNNNGISDFNSLGTLPNSLQTLDISGTGIIVLGSIPVTLQNLYINNTGFTDTFNIPTTIKHLECKNTAITTLNGNSSTSLEELICSDNNNLAIINLSDSTSLNVINLDNCLALTGIELNNTAIVDFDINNNISVQRIYLQNCTALNNVNVSGCTSLSIFYITNSLLRAIDVSTLPLITLFINNNNSLEQINAGSCQNLSNLDISGCTSLQEIEITNNSLITIINWNGFFNLNNINLFNCTGLISLDVSACFNLNNLNINNCSSLTTLNTTNTAISLINLSTNTLLVTFTASSSHISQIDLQNNTSIKYIYAQNCDFLQFLILNACTSLEQIDVTGSTNLPAINIDNQCTSLNNIKVSNTAFNTTSANFVAGELIVAATTAGNFDLSGCGVTIDLGSHLETLQNPPYSWNVTV